MVKFSVWQDVVMASGGTVSAVVTFDAPCDQLQIIVPALTSCSISLQVSEEAAGTYQDYGNDQTIVAGEGSFTTVLAGGGYQHYKIKSSVEQGAERTFKMRRAKVAFASGLGIFGQATDLSAAITATETVTTAVEATTTATEAVETALAAPGYEFTINGVNFNGYANIKMLTLDGNAEDDDPITLHDAGVDYQVDTGKVFIAFQALIWLEQIALIGRIGESDAADGAITKEVLKFSKGVQVPFMESCIGVFAAGKYVTAETDSASDNYAIKSGSVLYGVEVDA